MAAAKRSAKRSQDGPSYLPTCRNGPRGPTCLRCGLVRRQSLQRLWTGAISVRCAMAWRVRACSAPPMSAHVGEALSFVRSQMRPSTHGGTCQGYCEYSHLQYAAVRSCHSPPRPSAAAAAVPAHLQFASGKPSRGDVRTRSRARALWMLSSVAGPAVGSGTASVVDNTLQ